MCASNVVISYWARRFHVACLLTALAGGCAAPYVGFQDTRCRPVTRDGRLHSVVFTSSLKTEGHAGSQLIYRVRVLDSNFGAVKSRNGRYEDAAGNVAASKAFAVPDSPWICRDLTVSIPASELELRRTDLPAWAEFAVCNPKGVCVAQRHVRLPVDHPTQVVRGRSDTPGPRQSPKEKETDGRGSAEPPERTGPPEQGVGTGAATQPAANSGAGPRYGHLLRRLGQLAGREHQPADTEAPGSTPAGSATQPASRPASSASPGPAVSRSSPATTRPHGEPQGVGQGIRRAPAHEPAQPRAHDTLYRVKPGDTFRSIARQRYGEEGYWIHILLANPQLESVRLKAGEQIVLPHKDGQALPRDLPGPTEDSSVTVEERDKRRQERTWYVVGDGDTLSGIAHRLLGDASRWPEIYVLNRDRLESPDRLQVGMKLRVPAATAPPKSND